MERPEVVRIVRAKPSGSVETFSVVRKKLAEKARAYARIARNKDLPTAIYDMDALEAARKPR